MPGASTFFFNFDRLIFNDEKHKMNQVNAETGHKALLIN